MAFKMKGFSGFKKTDVDEYLADSAGNAVENKILGIKESVKAIDEIQGNVSEIGQSAMKKKQDIVKSKEAQIKDLLSDIQKLKERNNPGDNNRIKKLEAEIKRLQS